MSEICIMLNCTIRWLWWLEALAILFNLGFTTLYILHSPIAFAFGMIGPLLLGVLSWKRKLYADVILQVFYIFITFFGWLNLGENWSVTNIPLKVHLILTIIFLFIGFLIGLLLKKRTHAALPFLDSIITSISMLATALMMLGCHENWIYFMLINSTCIYLFFNRKLYGISMLYLLYLLLAIEGYFNLGWIPL